MMYSPLKPPMDSDVSMGTVVEDKVVTLDHNADMPHESDDLEQWVRTLKQTQGRLARISFYEEERKVESKEIDDECSEDSEYCMSPQANISRKTSISSEVNCRFTQRSCISKKLTKVLEKKIKEIPNGEIYKCKFCDYINACKQGIGGHTAKKHSKEKKEAERMTLKQKRERKRVISKKASECLNKEYIPNKAEKRVVLRQRKRQLVCEDQL